jgi:hypothetical protein
MHGPAASKPRPKGAKGQAFKILSAKPADHDRRDKSGEAADNENQDYTALSPYITGPAKRVRTKYATM